MADSEGRKGRGRLRNVVVGEKYFPMEYGRIFVVLGKTCQHSTIARNPQNSENRFSIDSCIPKKKIAESRMVNSS